MSVFTLSNFLCLAGSSQGVVYSIFSGDPQQYFSITPETGSIKTTSVPADRERYDFVLLNIRAEKSGVFANGQVRLENNSDNACNLMICICQ